MSNGVLQPEDLCVACFAENVKNLGTPSSNAEKYNNYRGLLALSEIVRKILREQQSIQKTLDQLQVQVNALSRS